MGSMEAAAAAEKPVIKVAALCGSLRDGSYNRGLIRYAMELTKEEELKGIEIENIDISSLPMLNTDLEVDGKPPKVVEAFRQKILEADSILFATPAYNYTLPAALKNAIDWASRKPNVFADKAAAVVSAAGDLGGARGQYHLRQIGVKLNLHFINTEFFLNAFQPPPKFDSDSNLIHPELKQRMKKVLLALQAFTLRLRGCKDKLSTTADFPMQIGWPSKEGHILTPFTEGNLAPIFHPSTQYKLVTTSEPYDLYDLETCNNGRSVIRQFQDMHFKRKDKRYTPNIRERTYKYALVASWVFFLIVVMLTYRVQDTCCKRNVFGRNLDRWVAYR